VNQDDDTERDLDAEMWAFLNRVGVFLAALFLFGVVVLVGGMT